MTIPSTVVIAPSLFSATQFESYRTYYPFVFLCIFEHHTIDYPDLVSIKTLGEKMEILKLFIKLCSNSENRTQTHNNDILMVLTD